MFCGDINYDKNIHEGVEFATPKLNDVDRVEIVKSTQVLADEVIENHFEEKTYILGFEENLKKLSEVYSRCLNNFKVSLALYPDNEKLAELKNEYKCFFEFFSNSSPLFKSLCIVPKEVNKNTYAVREADENAYIPNYSLGLSQLTPKNLRNVLDGACTSKEKKIAGALTYIFQEQSLVKCVRDDTDMLENGDANDLRIEKNVRPQRKLRASYICRSPYVSRVVDVQAHVVTLEERNVWDWLFQNRMNKKEFLFDWDNRHCTRGHFQSMQENKLIESTVIDTWTYLLNENEKLKDDASPLRLFVTTEATYGPLIMEVEDADFLGKQKRDALFDDYMDMVIQMVRDMHKKVYDVKDFDMFVFPIYDASHYYIISYNMKKPQMEIIDNRVPIDGVQGMYGDLPMHLHECFCHYLSIYNVPKYEEINALEPKVVRMGWKTTMNSVDCGVFVMRHMETYMGNLYAWKVGLRVEKDNQRALLNKMRIVYCHKMLTWSENTNRALILKGASQSAKGKKLAA